MSDPNDKDQVTPWERHKAILETMSTCDVRPGQEAVRRIMNIKEKG